LASTAADAALHPWFFFSTKQADVVPNAEALVLLGQLGLIVLVLGAGIDVDLPTLELVGTRGFIVALVGSALPISIGMFLAWLMGVGDTKTIIAAGAVFGPTSFGIAVNILKDGDVLKTYVPSTSTYIACSLVADVVT
jgi:Kef-type K+ transport system membrane component KefB